MSQIGPETSAAKLELLFFSNMFVYTEPIITLMLSTTIDTIGSESTEVDGRVVAFRFQ